MIIQWTNRIAYVLVLGMRSLAMLAIALLVGCEPRQQSGSCSAGETRCQGLIYETCVDGTFVAQETCAMACSEGLGCTACEVGTATCNGSTATVCNDSGSGFEDVECDPVQGMTCDP